MSEYGSPIFKSNEPKDSSSSDSDDDKRPTASSKKNRLFGSKVPMHAYLGGGKTADIVLWRNKQMAGGILVGVTVLWILFVGMGYHLITLTCHCLILSLSILFFGSLAAPLVSRSPPTLPDVILPDGVFLSVAHSLMSEINRTYASFRIIASGRDLKKFLKVISGLWVLSIVGKWFSFLTLAYLGFLILCCLPVLYEKYEDQVDDAAKKAMVEFNKQYKVLDDKVLQKIPGCPFSEKKK